MRFAVISDIHGNLTALEAVFTDIDAQTPPIEITLCAGDIVGHAAHPNEVIALLRERNIRTVRGNYDEVVAGMRTTSGIDYSTQADAERDRAAIEWTKSELTDENLVFLKGLSTELRLEASQSGRLTIKVQKDDRKVSEYRKSYAIGAFVGSLGSSRRRQGQDSTDLVVVHATTRDTVEYLLPGTAGSMFKSVASEADADVMIFGHTHQSFQRVVDSMAFIGVGSVGRQPGGAPAEYGIFEVSGGELDLEFRDVPYDAEREARDIEATDLPHELADALRPAVSVSR